MRIVNGCTLDIPPRIIAQVRKQYEHLRTSLRTKYHCHEANFRNILGPDSRNLNAVTLLADGELRGKRILDLGAGSIRSRDAPGPYHENPRMFEPWLCRALAELGAHPIGIDLYGIEGTEIFESYDRNLFSSKALDKIASESVDVGVAFKLVSSAYSRDRADSLVRSILPQLQRVLKPNAPFVYMHEGLANCSLDDIAGQCCVPLPKTQ